MNFTLTTKIERESGVITQKLKQDMDGLVEELQDWVYKTREQAMRQALIDLGWTPPQELP